MNNPKLQPTRTIAACQLDTYALQRQYINMLTPLMKRNWADLTLDVHGFLRREHTNSLTSVVITSGTTWLHTIEYDCYGELPSVPEAAADAYEWAVNAGLTVVAVAVVVSSRHGDYDLTIYETANE